MRNANSDTAGILRQGTGRKAALSPFTLALAALLSLSLAGCFQEPETQAGVDDFPNSIYARINENLKESDKADGLSLPPVAESLLDGPGVSVPATKTEVSANLLKGLGKLSAATADSGSGCSGAIIKWEIKHSPLPTKATVDSIFICKDAKFSDSIKNNETIVRLRSFSQFSSGRTELLEITDADGDGIINPVEGRLVKAGLNIVATEGGVIERTRMVTGPGPDQNYDLESDNLIYEIGWVKTRGTDTLAYAVIADADSDGVAVDNGEASRVDMEMYQTGPTADNPDAVWTRLDMRVLVRYKQENKEYTRFEVEVLKQDGRRHSAWIRNTRGGEEFDLRDTVVAHLRLRTTAPGDSLDSMETVLRMTVGESFDDKSDDSVYAIEVRSWKKLGEEKHGSFGFVSDRPIPSGQEPQYGTLMMHVDYTDDTSLDLEGRITDKTVDVTFRDRQGKRLHVVWDRSGKGLEMEKLD